MTAVPLMTPRLCLRAAGVGDGAALFSAFGDPETMHYWSSPAHGDADETRAHLAARIGGAGDLPPLAVTLRGDDRAIGLVSIMPRKPAVFEIGYIFVPSAKGQGLAREAVARAIDHIFDDLGGRRIYADTDPDNEGSIALLERLNFVREGYLREEWETHIGVRDTALYGLLRSDWANMR